MVAALVACAAALAAPASAQNGNSISGSFFIIAPSAGEQIVGQWTLPATIDGSVTVGFGAAGRRGTILWSPARTAQLSVVETRSRKGRSFDVVLGAPAQVSAVVNRAGGGRCSDVASGAFGIAASGSGAGGVRIALAGAGSQLGGFALTETRCGGPLSGDLAHLLPSVFVGGRKLRAGHFDIDLRGSAPLAVPDMSGGVESTVVVHAGRRIPEPRERAVPAGERPRPIRQLSVEYRIGRVRGSVSGSATGYGGLCAELDACGAQATWTLVPGGAGGSLTVDAFGPVERSARDLRAAVGLAPRGNTRGVDGYGVGTLDAHAGTLTGSWSRPGSVPCTDTRRLGAGFLQLEFGRQAVKASLIAGDLLGPVRTRCPGPGVSGGFTSPALARAVVPLGAFAKRRVVLRLRRSVHSTSDAWSGTTRGAVTVVLERRRAHVRVIKP
jgi:hypothetical protein